MLPPSSVANAPPTREADAPRTPGDQNPSDRRWLMAGNSPTTIASSCGRTGYALSLFWQTLTLICSTAETHTLIASGSAGADQTQDHVNRQTPCSATARGTPRRGKPVSFATGFVTGLHGPSLRKPLPHAKNDPIQLRQDQSVGPSLSHCPCYNSPRESRLRDYGLRTTNAETGKADNGNGYDRPFPPANFQSPR
jgi:hypothetical protein